MNDSYVLVLHEIAMHPHSYLKKLEGAFEAPSIVYVHSRDGLRKYTTPPVYDDLYLIVFEDKKIFEHNIAFLRLDFMFVVVVCSTTSQVNDVKHLCQDKEIPAKVFNNEFRKADGMDLIRELATEQVSDAFCKALLSRVGLSPKRIVSAMMVCEQVGYKTSNITKYIDKYSYVDVYDVLESLLNICKSGAQRTRASLYIHQNRFWYAKYTRQTLVKEVELLLKMYRDITEGVLTEYTVDEYVESEGVPRFRVLYACSLFEKIPYVRLLSLKTFLEHASILEVAMKLS